MYTNFLYHYILFKQYHPLDAIYIVHSFVGLANIVLRPTITLNWGCVFSFALPSPWNSFPLICFLLKVGWFMQQKEKEFQLLSTVIRDPLFTEQWYIVSCPFKTFYLLSSLTYLLMTIAKC